MPERGPERVERWTPLPDKGSAPGAACPGTPDPRRAPEPRPRRPHSHAPLQPQLRLAARPGSQRPEQAEADAERPRSHRPAEGRQRGGGRQQLLQQPAATSPPNHLKLRPGAPLAGRPRPAPSSSPPSSSSSSSCALLLRCHAISFSVHSFPDFARVLAASAASFPPGVPSCRVQHGKVAVRRDLISLSTGSSYVQPHSDGGDQFSRRADHPLRFCFTARDTSWFLSLLYCRR